MVNRKTENRMGVRFGAWQGVVVSVDDPLKSGRVQIRIYSDNDDKTNCSDSSLFWSHPSSPIQSASCNHKGLDRQRALGLAARPRDIIG